MKKKLIWLLAIAITLLLYTGCSLFGRKQQALDHNPSKAQAYNSNKSFPDEIPPLEPVPGEPEFPNKIPNLAPVNEEGKLPLEIPPLKPVPGETNKPSKPTPSPTAAPGGYDWLLSVDDNITMDIQGMKWSMNLYMSMTKSGGRDLTGEFTGKILLTSEMDQASMKKTFEENTDMIFDSGNAKMTIEAVKAAITVVKYDSKAYREFAGSNGLGPPPKSAPDYMAVGTIDMKTRFISHQWGHDTAGEGEGWIPDQEISSPVPVRLLITGSQVTAYVGFGGDQPFKGIISGKIK